MIIEKVINEYNDGLSVIEVADKLNLDRNKVKRILLKNGIKIRTRGETQLLNRNYRCFETIDSEEKSYWLGFIMADGCCIKNKLTIGLKGEDKSHLEKFKKFINSPNKISEGVVKLNNKIFTSCCFTVTCKILVQDLLKYGVTERKSNTLDPNLNLIPKEFLKDFWRGVIDGDGSVILVDNRYVTISLTGTKLICKKLLEFSDNEHNKIIDKINNKAKSVSISCDNGYNLMILLYENSIIYLDRKYNRYLTYKSIIINYRENILPELNRVNGLKHSKKVKLENIKTNDIIEFDSLNLLKIYLNIKGGGFNTCFKSKCETGKLYKNTYKFSYINQ